MLQFDLSKRIYGLDILRSIAIISVMYRHGYLYAQHVISDNAYKYFNFDGVSLFFVLSGFLIGIILIKTLEDSGIKFSTIKAFWVRRWFRTLPLYFLVLIFITIVRMLGNEPTFLFKIKQYFFFLQNFYSFKTKFFITSWSLSVEEWFYLIVPLLLWGLIAIFKLSTKRALQLGIIFFIIICPFLRYYRLQELVAAGLYGTDRFSFTVLCRLDGIMLGLAASYLFTYYRTFWDSKKKLLLAIGLIIVAIDYYLSIFSAPYGLKDNKFYDEVIHYTLLPIGIFFIMPFFNSVTKGRGILVYVVTLLSVVSYSLYLLHNTVVMPMIIPFLIRQLLKIIGNSAVAYSVIYIAYWSISLIISVLVYKYYEHPMTNLRDKIGKRSKLKTVKQAEENSVTAPAK